MLDDRQSSQWSCSFCKILLTWAMDSYSTLAAASRSSGGKINSVRLAAHFFDLSFRLSSVALDWKIYFWINEWSLTNGTECRLLTNPIYPWWESCISSFFPASFGKSWGPVDSRRQGNPGFLMNLFSLLHIYRLRNSLHLINLVLVYLLQLLRVLKKSINLSMVSASFSDFSTKKEQFSFWHLFLNVQRTFFLFNWHLRP